MRVEISSLLLAKLQAAVAASPEAERCGLLFGARGRVTDISFADNIAANPQRHFELDPAHLISAHRAARGGGPAVIGHWHSHPIGTAEPSPEDARSAAPDGRIWLILSASEVRLWRAVENGPVQGRFEPLALAVV
jgi:proteasome lid subunit RPN8/RPN11